MNKDYKSILALLAVEAIAVSEDGSATLSAFQLQQIEAALAVNADKLATADKDNKDLQKQVKDLTAQIEALQKADGDDTTHIEGDGQQVQNHTAAARADYEKLKSIL